MESSTFLHSYFGDNLFVIVLATEIYMVLLHNAAMFNKIPLGKPYKESFIKINLFFETYAIHTCYWHFWHRQNNVMLFHYVFHLITNFINCFIDCPDFSKEIRGGVSYLGRISVLLFDMPCHVYNVYKLVGVLSFIQILEAIVLFVVVTIPFPKRLIFARETK